MTAEQAYLSFCRMVEQKLAIALPALTVAIEKDDTISPPYVTIEDGGMVFNNGVLSRGMCQLRLVLRALESEPLALTRSRYQPQIVKAINQLGQCPKYDYTQNPPKATGNYVILLDGWTPDLSDIGIESQTVLKVYLDTNITH